MENLKDLILYKRVVEAQEVEQATLVMLPGFTGSSSTWDDYISIWSKNDRLVLLDMLGFGASRKASANYKIDLWVDQVYEFWQTFIRQPIVLVGNSIGSLVCLAAAAAHRGSGPTRCAGTGSSSTRPPRARRTGTRAPRPEIGRASCRERV